MNVFAARSTKTTRPLVLLERSTFDGWLRRQNATTRGTLKAQGFRAEPGQVGLVFGRDHQVSRAVATWSSDGTPWPSAHLVEQLPTGRYALENELSPRDANAFCLGWALGAYRYTRYKSDPRKLASLVWPVAADRHEVERLASATGLARDLVTTPAGDLGPTALAQTAREIATRYGAAYTEILGEELITENYPAIHAVGRACDDPPRLIDFVWGEAGAPRVTLVGKGVCFDTGGLDIKPSSGMLLMKKDMGGAAMVLAVAQAVMDAELPVRLRVLIPAVENSVSGNAFHPLDVLRTRKGITVEVGNTDAEGRLILCDALAEADLERPELLIDFATLTGAARVALGTELPALFSNQAALARELQEAGDHVADPLWHMPLYAPYRRHLESTVADINNVGSNRFGGAITAALFLQTFVSPSTPWLHIDLMAYNNDTRPGRPAGGEAMGVRAVYELLKRRYASQASEDEGAA